MGPRSLHRVPQDGDRHRPLRLRVDAEMPGDDLVGPELVVGLRAQILHEPLRSHRSGRPGVLQDPRERRARRLRDVEEVQAQTGKANENHRRNRGTDPALPL
jgi:hypothetical protein